MLKRHWQIHPIPSQSFNHKPLLMNISIYSTVLWNVFPVVLANRMWTTILIRLFRETSASVALDAFEQQLDADI